MSLDIVIGVVGYRVEHEGGGWLRLYTRERPARPLGRARVLGGKVVFAERDRAGPQGGTGPRSVATQAMQDFRSAFRAQAVAACAAYAAASLPEFAAAGAAGCDVRAAVMDDLAARVALGLEDALGRDAEVLAEGAPRWNDAAWSLQGIPTVVEQDAVARAIVEVASRLAGEMPEGVTLEGPLLVRVVEGAEVRATRRPRSRDRGSAAPAPAPTRRYTAIAVGVAMLGAASRAVLVPLEAHRDDA